MRVTVHVLVALGPRLLGLQVRDEIWTETARAMVALAELPL